MTKIEVYKGLDKRKEPYVACIVFYEGHKIIAAPNCGDLGLVSSTPSMFKVCFIDRCPANGFTCETHEIPSHQKLVGFTYDFEQ